MKVFNVVPGAVRARRMALGGLFFSLPLSAEPLQLPMLSVEALPSWSSAEWRAGSGLDGSDSAGLLGRLPGAGSNAAGGLSSLPVVRGLADDRLRIKVDGMDLIAACPNHMNPALSYISPQELESLQLYAGISPVSLGGDSIGGSLIASSAEPQFAEAGQGSVSGGRLSSFWQSNNHAHGQSLSARLASEWLSLRYSGSRSEAHNYHAAGSFAHSRESGEPGRRVGSSEVASSAYEVESQRLGLALRGSAGLLDLQLGYQHVPQEGFANQRMDMTGNTRRFINLRARNDFDWGGLETRLYHEQVEHRMNFGPDRQFWYGTAPGMPMASEADTTGLTLLAQIDLNESALLRLGTEHQRHRLDDYWRPSGTGSMAPDTFWNIRAGQRDRHALFAEWQGALAEAWQGQFGVRYEHVRSDAGRAQGYGNAMGKQLVEAAAFNARNHARRDNNFDAAAQLRYRHSAQLDVELGLAHKVRSPNLYERYSWSSWMMAAAMNNTAGDGNGYVGNLDLRPEAANTLALTLDWHNRAGDRQLRLTPFYTRVNDYVDARPAAGTNWQAQQFNVLQYSNQSARLYGLDLDGQWALGSTDWGRWALEGRLNHVNGRNRDSGEALYNLMPLNARLALNWQQAAWSAGLELQGVRAKSRYSRVRNEPRTAGYGLLNLNASHQWQQLRLDFTLGNLLNKRYDLPTGGSYTAQGRSMSLNGITWGTPVPGMGRHYGLAATLEF